MLMRTRCFTAVVLAVDALAIYKGAGHSVAAQSQPFPFRIGEVVTLSFQGGGSRPCRIDDIRGTFALCGDTTERRGFGVSRLALRDEWVNVSVVEWITRAREER
jgi:hypothetical protein